MMFLNVSFDFGSFGEFVLVLLANNQLERLHQVRGVGQRHAAAGHVDDQGRKYSE